MCDIQLLDGGFSTQLAKYVSASIDGDPLWSARFLYTHPESCVAAHRDFIKAGADIITTGSYQASVEGFGNHLGLKQKEALQVMKNSVHLVREAIRLEENNTGIKRNVLVAGSVGPYGACLHDGSEYTGSYSLKMTQEELINWHRPRVESLLEAGVDLLAFETIPCSSEAFALITLLKKFPNIRAWLSFSVSDMKHISNGDEFEYAAEQVWNEGGNQLVGVGVNCLHPALVTPVLQKLSNKNIPLVAYPNSGEIYDATHGLWLKSDRTVTGDYVEEWLNLGVKIIGGCCRTTDKEVAHCRNIIDSWCNKSTDNVS